MAPVRHRRRRRPLGEPELDDVTVAEDGGNAAFRVTLSRESSTVTVQYATEEGTAKKARITRWSGTFQSGETERTITVR